MNSLWRSLVVSLILLAAGPARAELLIDAVSPADVTHSGFTILWKTSVSAEPDIAVYADSAGTSEITGNLEIVKFPLRGGDPEVTTVPEREDQVDLLRDRSRAYGLMGIAVRGCRPETSYYYQVISRALTGEIAIWPTSGLSTVTTVRANALVSDSKQLLVTLTHSESTFNPAGWRMIATAGETRYPVAAVVGDGAAANQAYLDLNHFFAADGTNWMPEGPRTLELEIRGPDSLPIMRTLDVDYTGDFAVANVVPQAVSAESEVTNNAPTLSGTPAIQVNEDSPYLFLPTAVDPDPDDTLTFGIVNRPIWASFDPATGKLSGTPDNSHVGITTGIVISVTDNGGLSASLPAFDLTVLNVNDPPAISGTPATSVSERISYRFVPDASDPDAGDALTFSIVNQPAWATFEPATGELAGTPDNSHVGVTTGIVITVTDGGGLFASLPAFDLAVININDAPTISGTPATSVAEKSVYRFAPTAGDPDVGDALIFSIENQPAWADFNPATGELTGTPDNSHVGKITGIVITVTDKSGLTAILPAFDLTVINVNDAPTISGNPGTSVEERSAYHFVPTAIDPDVGDTLMFTIVNKPSWAAFNPFTGALSGAPDSSHLGKTSGIEITVTDAGGLSASLPAFDLTVVNVNDAPTISGTPGTSVAEKNDYRFFPTAADPDPDDTLTFGIENSPAWAAFDQLTGELSGTPGNADVGTTTGIVIRVTDSGGLSASLPAFDLTVINVNDPPVISGTPATSVDEDTSYTFTPTAVDPDPGDSLTFTIENRPEWSNFNSATGELSGTPDNSHVGTTSGIVITVTDIGGLSASLPPFDLTVVNVNDAPTITGSPAIRAYTGIAYRFVPEAGDIDAGDSLTFSISDRPAWASFDPATGELSGMPGVDHVGATPGIVITVTDGGGLSASLPAFDLTVVNAAENGLPVISGSPGTSVNEESAYLFVPIASDPDGDILSFSIMNRPSWARFDPSTGELSGAPGNADVGITVGIVITVTDGGLSASLPAFDLTVVNVNDAPVISGTPIASVAEKSVYRFVPTASDPDAGDSLVFSIENKPTWASFDPATGELTGTPGNADVGTTIGIVIKVADIVGLEANLPAFDLTVVNVNDPPEISGAPATSVDERSLYHFAPTASDPDAADSLSFSIENMPGWASFDRFTGAISGIPEGSHLGTTSGIVITVTDSGGLSASLPAFDLTVVNVNDPPEISGIPATSVAEKSEYRFVPSASDPDVGDTLTFSIENRPVWASFDPANGELFGTPENSHVGATTGIVIRVTDGGGLFASLPPFNLTVVNVNDPPEISGTPATGVDQGQPYQFVPTVTDPDAGETLSFTIVNKPAWAAFDPMTGELSGTPDNSHVGTTTGIVIMVTDIGGLSASHPAFDLAVANVNDPPAISGTPATSAEEGFAYSFVPTAADLDVGDALTFSIVNLPVWATFDPATGALSGMPEKADVGTTGGIVITVTDTGGLSASLPAFDLTVVPSLPAPGTYYVDADNPEPGDGSRSNPWQTLHEAVDLINASVPGAYTLVVEEGLYATEGNGGKEPDAPLIITRSQVTISGGDNPPTLDGVGAVYWGAGIEIAEGSGVTVARLIIRNFKTGISVTDCSATVQNNLIDTPTEVGIRIQSAAGAIRPNLSHNTIAGGDYGMLIEEGVETSGTADPVIAGNIISAFRVSGIHKPDGADISVVAYNALWGGGTNYGGILTDRTNRNGNISEDPLFEAGSILFRLSAGSAGIDAIPPEFHEYPVPDDLTGAVRPRGDGFDMGCHETERIYYTAAFMVGGNGSVTGPSVQSVPHGGRTEMVKAVPDAGYHFVEWSVSNGAVYESLEQSGDSLAVTGVASDIRITAVFSINLYPVLFEAGPGGRIEGNSSQQVSHGGATEAVTAVPEAGWEFAGWTGDYTGSENPLTIESIISGITVKANFRNSSNHSPVKPQIQNPLDNARFREGDEIRLVSGPFTDADSDSHFATQWMIRRADEPDYFYTATVSAGDGLSLTDHLVSANLKTGLCYMWRVGYQDGGSGRFTWSDEAVFAVGLRTRDINVPKVIGGRRVESYRMVSYVQWPDNPSAGAIFGPLLNKKKPRFKIGIYDPNRNGVGGYHVYPDFDVVPGKAYWFLVSEEMNFQTNGVDVSTSENIAVPLAYNETRRIGWNMIACPNKAKYYWGDIQVVEKDADGNILNRVDGKIPTIKDLDSDNPYIDLRIWEWKAGAYEARISDSFVLEPYTGYWVKARKSNIYLGFAPEVQVALRNPSVLISGLTGRGAEYLNRMVAPGTAFADNDDSPPMPMGDLDGGADAGGGSGCFVETAAAGTGWSRVMFLALIGALGVLLGPGRVAVRKKNGSLLRFRSGNSKMMRS